MNTQQIPDAAHAALCASFALRDSWNKAERAAVAIFGPGPLTSGLGNASLADTDTKEHIRALNRAAQDAADRSLEAWRAAGRRTHTWRRWRDAMWTRWYSTCGVQA